MLAYAKRKLKEQLKLRGFERRSELDPLCLLTSGLPTPPLTPLARERQHTASVTFRLGRIDLPALARAGGTAIELGVASGYFSEAILNFDHVAKLYSVDCWGDHHDDREYVAACARLAKFGTRSVVLRSLFEDVLPLFSDEHFDFIYIDAYAHTGQQDGGILADWYPKLKVGGIFAGHDYDAQSWPQTVAAVDGFAASMGKQIRVVPAASTNNPEDRHPSWFFSK